MPINASGKRSQASILVHLCNQRICRKRETIPSGKRMETKLEALAKLLVELFVDIKLQGLARLLLVDIKLEAFAELLVELLVDRYERRWETIPSICTCASK